MSDLKRYFYKEFIKGQQDSYADGGSTDDKHLVAKAIEYITGYAVDTDSIVEKDLRYNFKYKNRNVSSSLNSKLVHDTIRMNKKSLESRYTPSLATKYAKGGEIQVNGLTQQEYIDAFNNRIEKLVFFKNPIQIGEQYILPENSLEWTDMLRIVWNEKYVEKPRFFEEFSSNKILQQKVHQEKKTLTNTLKSYLNPEDPKTNSLLYKELTTKPSVIPILNKLGYSDKLSNITENTILFSEDNLRELRELSGRKASFLQLNLTTIPVLTEISKVPNKKFPSFPVYVIIIDKQSSGLLVKESSNSLLFTDLPDVLQNLFI
jgi:hypothetical protein